MERMTEKEEEPWNEDDEAMFEEHNKLMMSEEGYDEEDEDNLRQGSSCFKYK